MNLIDILMHATFFITECVVTSRALNSAACVAAISAHMGGHPLLAYVNGALCLYDGCLLVSYVLYVLLLKGGRRP